MVSSLIGLNQDLPGFTRLHKVIASLYQVLLGFTGFYLVLPGFPRLNEVFCLLLGTRH